MEATKINSLESQMKERVNSERNEIKFCPVCNSCIEDRIITIYQSLIVSLYDVYQWCGEHQRHEFKMRDIRHLLKHNEYARFGDLIRFGGIVYRPEKKGTYGINMNRAKEFFDGKYAIPSQIVVNQITKEIQAATYVSIWDIPELSEFLDGDGAYNQKALFTVTPDKATQIKRKLPTVEEYYSSERP